MSSYNGPFCDIFLLSLFSSLFYRFGTTSNPPAFLTILLLFLSLSLSLSVSVTSFSPQKWHSVPEEADSPKRGRRYSSASCGAMLDDRLDPERLSQVESLGSNPVRGAGIGAEWRASSARAAVAAAGSEAAKRSNEQPGDEDDDDERRVRFPLAPAGGYERWQWGRILGNYRAFLFFFYRPHAPSPAFPHTGKRVERLFRPSYICTGYVLSYAYALRRLRILRKDYDGVWSPPFFWFSVFFAFTGVMNLKVLLRFSSTITIYDYHIVIICDDHLNYRLNYWDCHIRLELLIKLLIIVYDYHHMWFEF